MLMLSDVLADCPGFNLPPSTPHQLTRKQRTAELVHRITRALSLAPTQTHSNKS